MSKAHKITVAVTPEQAEALRDSVTAGDFATTSDAVRAALSAWSEQRELPGWTVEGLRAAISMGRDSGLSDLPDLSAVKSEARRRAGL